MLAFAELPHDALVQIASQLGAFDVKHLARTCKALYLAATDDFIWEHFVRSYFGGDACLKKYPLRHGWRAYFVKLYTSTFDLFTCGDNSSNRQGLAKALSSRSTTPTFLDGGFSQVACTWYHNIGIQENQVVVGGEVREPGIDGEYCSAWHRKEGLPERLPLKKVACSTNSAGVLTKAGDLYLWDPKVGVPQLLEAFSGRVLDFGCAEGFTVIVLRDGEIWASNGPLSMSFHHIHAGTKGSAVYCGQYSFVVITTDGGCFGAGSPDAVEVMRHSPATPADAIETVACGATYTLYITKSHDLLMGKVASMMEQPQPHPFFVGEKMAAIGGTNGGAMCLLRDGRIFAWGDNVCSVVKSCSLTSAESW
eukprot:TRINITY_DN1311_c0_g1_i1.p1 TRINITY_DN1311_c0_g1~~TRINITY_DN1311_c0_g1_i1.p1  ORF type:complete len:365 (+),score=35.15 TRINITY_DN1311_c0_g1_i1:832-1926(+)